ncbi:MAG TPA: DNRLRE domain-containing protein [Polyangiaceae bacterium]|nr:DNRLRE domain-containing protein [Polyangiaceae bacterium]
MASIRRVLGSRIALGAAVLASACQHDSSADFDDTNLQSTDGGSAATSSGSSSGAAAGHGAEAATTSTGGSSAEAGGSSGGSGGKPAGSAGAGGSANGGKASSGGSNGTGGKSSAGASGTGNEAGKAGGQGGSAGTTGDAGKGGGPVEPPQPVTFETTDIDETQIASCLPYMNFGALETVNVDGDLACRYEILFNAPLQEVPEGALVSAASLSLTCTNAGDPIKVSYVAEEWAELSVKWNNRPQVGKELETITCEEVGQVTIDLTAAVKAWLGGAQPNYGIYLRVETTDGSDFATSEASDATTRPKLSVTYTLPVK